MLHHNGQVKLYDYNEVQKAVDDAVKIVNFVVGN